MWTVRSRSRIVSHRVVLLAGAVALLSPSAARGQASATAPAASSLSRSALKELDPADVAFWKNIRNATTSFDGTGFAYLLASKRIFPWEKRADDWAIARVGEDIYWTTKEEIRAVTLWRK